MKPFLFFLILLIFTAAMAFGQKYDWAKGIGGSGSDQISAMSLDPQGNIYVAGSFQNTADFDPGPGISNLISGGVNNIFFAKYDNNGNYLWAKRIGGATNDVAYNIRVGPSGNIYVSGYFSSTNVDFDPGPGVATLSSTASSYDAFIAKYDQNGNYIWAKKIGGSGADNAWAIEIDNAENIYVSGYFWATVDFDPGPGVANLVSAGNYDIYLAKYDNLGNYTWAKKVGGTGDDKAYALDVDAAGNIVIGGSFQGTVDFDPTPIVLSKTSAGSYDIFVSRYDNAGNFLWANTFGGTAEDRFGRIAIDALGNFYMTGAFQGAVDFDPSANSVIQNSNGGFDMLLAKYDAGGNYIWAKGIGGTSADQSWGVSFDDSLNVFMTGRFYNTADFNPGASPALFTSAGLGDIFIAKYTQAGIYQFAINMGGSGDDLATPIAVDPLYNLYIGGSFNTTADFDPDPLSAAPLTSAGVVDAHIAKYIQCFPAGQPLLAVADDTICVGDADTLKVIGGALNKATYWQWYTDSCGGIPIDTGASIVVFPGQHTTYYVRGEGGCPEPGPCNAISIVVHPLPIITAETKGTVCVDDIFQLFADSHDPIVSWQWYGPGGFLCYSEDTTIPHASLAYTGDYIVFGKDTNGCISQPVTVSTTVYALPKIEILNQDTSVLYGTIIHLQATGASIYSWSPIYPLDNPFDDDPYAHITENTLFIVNGIDSFGCGGADTMTVAVTYDDPYFIPSAFSPNGDGRNDVFKVVNLSFQKLQEFRVFNRWGQEVFSTNNPYDGWDGSFKGVPQEMGTYHYLIRIGLPNGEAKSFKGDVTLLR